MGTVRQALRYVIRNQSLPQRTRAQAQLQLTQMHCYTRPTQIKNRCIVGGKGRGIFRDFRMSRVGFLQSITWAEASLKMNKRADVLAVQFPDERIGWQSPGGEESKLVVGRNVRCERLVKYRRIASCTLAKGGQTRPGEAPERYSFDMAGTSRGHALVERLSSLFCAPSGFVHKDETLKARETIKYFHFLWTFTAVEHAHA